MSSAIPISSEPEDLSLSLKLPRRLFALTLGALALGTSEFGMIGILPDIERTYHVSISQAGLTVSAFALGVVIGAPLFTILCASMLRKKMLWMMLVIFIIGNVLSAVAPNFGFLVFSRILSGLPHGAFLGIGVLVAADSVRSVQRSQAISRMMIGLTGSNIIGVPLIAFLASLIGWRWDFVLISIIAALSIGLIIGFIPNDPKYVAANNLLSEFTVFLKLQVWLALLVIVFGFASLFAFYTYVVPIFTESVGFSSQSVPLLLVSCGLGMTLGMHYGGKLADKIPMLSQFIGMIALLVLLIAFYAMYHTKVIAVILLILIPLVVFIVNSCMQIRLLEETREAPGLASASMQSAINIANSIGAFVGGYIIDKEYALPAVCIGGALLTIIGIILTIIELVWFFV